MPTRIKTKFLGQDPKPEACHCCADKGRCYNLSIGIQDFIVVPKLCLSCLKAMLHSLEETIKIAKVLEASDKVVTTQKRKLKRRRKIKRRDK